MDGASGDDNEIKDDAREAEKLFEDESLSIRQR